MVQFKINKNKAEKLERLVKSKLAAKGCTLTDLAYLISTQGEKNETPQSLSQKLKRGTMKYIDIENIANILGYNIKWEVYE